MAKTNRKRLHWLEQCGSVQGVNFCGRKFCKLPTKCEINASFSSNESCHILGHYKSLDMGLLRTMMFVVGLHSANCILAVALTFTSKDTFVTVLEKKYERYSNHLAYLYKLSKHKHTYTQASTYCISSNRCCLDWLPPLNYSCTIGSSEQNKRHPQRVAVARISI